MNDEKFTFLDLTVIETTHEVYTSKWIYRFLSSKDIGGCVVKRLPVNAKAMWQHGVFVQLAAWCVCTTRFKR